MHVYQGALRSCTEPAWFAITALLHLCRLQNFSFNQRNEGLLRRKASFRRNRQSLWNHSLMDSLSGTIPWWTVSLEPFPEVRASPMVSSKVGLISNSHYMASFYRYRITMPKPFQEVLKALKWPYLYIKCTKHTFLHTCNILYIGVVKPKILRKRL